MSHCIIQQDLCAKCGESHRTASCNSMTTISTPCGVQGHTGSNQNCPTFLRKCADHNARNPKDLLPSFPSMEAWTWESTPPSGQWTAVPVGLADCVRLNRGGGMRQTQLSFQLRQITPNGKELKQHSWNRLVDHVLHPPDNQSQNANQPNNEQCSTNE